jgi:hypothetical protein
MDFFTRNDIVIFFRMPNKISALSDKWFSDYSRFSGQKGVVLLFFWVKIETQISLHL